MRVLSVVTLALALACGAAQGALTHRYTFDVDASDSSGNGNDGTLVGAATVSGGVLDLRQGSNGGPETEAGVQLPINAFSTPGTDMTMMACIRLERIAELPEAFIFGWANTAGTNSPNLQLRVNGNNGAATINPLQIGRWDGGAFSAVQAPTSGPGTVDLRTDPAQWHHVAATITGGTQTSLYINGALVASGSLTSGLIGTPTTFWLGTMDVGGGTFIRPFEGQMDDVRIYNEALDAAAIASIAAQCIPEPASVALALVGLGGLGCVVRRRK